MKQQQQQQQQWQQEQFTALACLLPHFRFLHLLLRSFEQRM